MTLTGPFSKYSWYNVIVEFLNFLAIFHLFWLFIMSSLCYLGILAQYMVSFFFMPKNFGHHFICIHNYICWCYCCYHIYTFLELVTCVDVGRIRVATLDLDFQAIRMQEELEFNKFTNNWIKSHATKIFNSIKSMVL